MVLLQNYLRIKKQQKDILKIIEALVNICSGEPINPIYKNHLLLGEYNNFFECHIEPDLLIIYKIDNDNKTVIFTRIGSHSELFN